MKKIFAGLLFFCLFTALSSSVYAAQTVSVNASVDKRLAQAGEEINLTITVSGAQGNIQAPRLPSLKNTDVFYTGRASHFAFVNGESSSTVEFSYVLVAQREGEITLPPLEVYASGEKLRTDPILITISGKAPKAGYNQQASAPVAQPQRQQQAAPPMPPAQQQRQPDQEQELPPTFRPEDQNIFVKAWVDKDTAFPNEQILLTYSLYTRYDTRYEGFEEEASVSGFWIEEFPPEKDVERETVRFNGLRYVKADIKRVALFPTAPADYTIQPGVLKASIRQDAQNSSVFDEFFNDSFFSGGGFFSRRENRLLKPPPIQIKVIPFPEEGKPDTFEGAVGNFRLSATVDKQKIKQNEPVTMTLVIEGEGNIETLNKPKVPEMKGVKIYDADTKSQLLQSVNVISGRKSFSTVFIPMEAGELKIPSLPFSYFNPQTRTYQTLTTPEFTVQVEKSEEAFKMPAALSQQEAFKKEVTVEGKDVRFIDEKMPDPTERMAVDYTLKGLLGLDAFLVLLLLIGFWRNIENQIYAKDSALKRRRFAKGEAMKGIAKIQKLVRSRDQDSTEACFEEIERTLTHYLADKWGVSQHGITREILQLKLENTLGEKDPLFQEIFGLYQLCDESKFAKASVAQEQKGQALRVLKETIARIEKVRK